mmetsp:Transcript_36560/g.92449  ORF Transcript_36560/g.92449 Transcript_36560/m.92449 type:complete len:113 (-) Transcript_36560:35-373(-)
MPTFASCAAVTPVGRPTAVARPLNNNPRGLVSQHAPRRVAAPPRAFPVEVGWVLAESANKAGSVDAPAWVLPLAAVVIAIVGGGSAILLKPGDDAAREMRERDNKKFNKYDK